MEEAVNPSARLLLIGGAERHDPESPILKHFVDIAGGGKAKILICGAASDDATKLLKEYEKCFRALGAAEVWPEKVRMRTDADGEDLVQLVEESTAVFFTGGDQLRLTTIVAGTRMAEALAEKMRSSKYVVAGTSAGAAALGSVMILGGAEGGSVRRVDVDLGPGLGYLSNSVVDTHFNARGRVARLLTVFAQNSQVLGVGLDEDTALDVKVGSEYRVHGSGVVMLFDGRVSFSSAPLVDDDHPMAMSAVSLHVLSEGYGFDPNKMEVITPGHVYDVDPETPKMKS